MFELIGKTALITGASGLIGGAIARALHAQGATIGISGTRVGALETLAAEIGGDARLLPCDLSDPDALAALPKQAEEALGSVDILVNNAGITADNLAMRMSDEQWSSVLDVDLTAAFKLSRSVLRGMMKRRWGRIICIASVVGAIGNPGQANYAAAKAGMIGMTKALAHEVATRGITVNAVAPGLIETSMTRALDDSQRDSLLGRIPVQRLGTPEEVAASVSFLASEEAGYVTGATLHVNGGLAML